MKTKYDKKLIISLILSFILISSIRIGKVKTDSMEPVLSPGSVFIYTFLIDKNAIKEGDIIIYKDDFGRLICHRVIYSTSDYLITKGDSIDEVDPKITRKQIIGKYLFKIFR